MTPAEALQKLGACQERTDVYTRFKTMGRAYNHMRRKAMEGDTYACHDIWWLIDTIALRQGVPCIIYYTVPAQAVAQLLPWEIIKHMLEGLV